MGNENIIPYGVDFSNEGIEYTKEMLKEYGLGQYADNMSVGTLTQLPYQDNFFEGIICYGVLYYLSYEDIKKAVQEMTRVLKPDGKLLLVVRTIEDYRYNKTEEVDGEKHTTIINEGNEEKCAYSENGMLMHFFDEEELKTLFSGYKELKIDYIKETHDNQKFCDSNYILTAEK